MESRATERPDVARQNHLRGLFHSPGSRATELLAVVDRDAGKTRQLFIVAAVVSLNEFV